MLMRRCYWIEEAFEGLVLIHLRRMVERLEQVEDDDD